jgi:hypothetical protein
VTEIIERAAIVIDGTVHSVPKPGRHHDVIRAVFDATGKTVVGEQGFVTSSGRFVNRLVARKIAETAKQLIAGRRDNDGIPYVATDDRLFSEDVW